MKHTFYWQKFKNIEIESEKNLQLRKNPRSSYNIKFMLYYSDQTKYIEGKTAQ